MVAFAGPAMAEMSYDNNSGGSVLLYGQINPAIQSVNDGGQTETNLVDSAHSNTRVGVNVQQPFGDNNFAFKFETALGAPSSDAHSQSNQPSWTWNRTKLRHIDLSLAGRYGTFSAGQGNMATDGVAQSDLSGTTLTTYVALNDTAGGFKFRNSDGTLSDINISSLNSDFDGSRKGRVRYDSPNFNGFGVAVAYGREILSEAPNASKDDYYDIGVTYKRSYDSVQVAAAVGHSQRKRDAGSTDKNTLGSVALLFGSGFNLTAAAGSQSNGGNYAYGKVGYQANWFQSGSTSIAVDYYNGKDFNSGLTDDKFQSYGLGVVQRIERYNVDGYLGFRNYDAKATGESYQKINSYLLGARWRF
jgi:hypothetical protein